MRNLSLLSSAMLAVAITSSGQAAELAKAPSTTVAGSLSQTRSRLLLSPRRAAPQSPGLQRRHLPRRGAGPEWLPVVAVRRGSGRRRPRDDQGRRRTAARSVPARQQSAAGQGLGQSSARRRPAIGAWLSRIPDLEALDRGRHARRSGCRPHATGGHARRADRAPGKTYTLRVLATFADGTTRRRHRACAATKPATSRSPASISTGQVTATGVGDAALIVRYRAEPGRGAGHRAAARAEPFPQVTPRQLHRRARPGQAAAAEPAAVAAGRRRHVPAPRPPRRDRRAADAGRGAGVPGRPVGPTSARRRSTSCSPDPGHAALWTLKFCDLLKASDFGVYADALPQEADAPRFQAWVRARLEENMPYDQFVERILHGHQPRGPRRSRSGPTEVMALHGGLRARPARPGRCTPSARRSTSTGSGRGADGVPRRAAGGPRLPRPAARVRPVPPPSARRLAAGRPAELRQLLHARPHASASRATTRRSSPTTAAVIKQFNDEGKKLDDEVKKLKEGEGQEARRGREEGQDRGRQADGRDRPSSRRPRRPPRQPQKRDKSWQRAQRDDGRQATKLPPGDGRHGPPEQAAARGRPAAAARRDPPAAAKASFAKVTSPLGTQTSKRSACSGETQTVDVRRRARTRGRWSSRGCGGRTTRTSPRRSSTASGPTTSAAASSTRRTTCRRSTRPRTRSCSRSCADGFIENSYDLHWLHRTILDQPHLPAEPARPAAENAMRPRELRLLLPAAACRPRCCSTPSTRRPARPRSMDMKYYHWPDELTDGRGAVHAAERVRRRSCWSTSAGRSATRRCSATASATAAPRCLQVLSLANHPRVWAEDRRPDTAAWRKLLKEIDRRRGARRGAVPGDARAACRPTPSAHACLKYRAGRRVAREGLAGRAVELAEHAGVSAAALIASDV